MSAYRYDDARSQNILDHFDLYIEAFNKIERCKISKDKKSTFMSLVYRLTNIEQLKKVLSSLMKEEEVKVHEGLQAYPVNGNGDCLYEAITYYFSKVGTEVAYLRHIVAAHLEYAQQYEPERYAGFIPLSEGQTIQEYIANIRSTHQWLGNVEINILMRLLNRPVVVVERNGTITNLDEVRQYANVGDPIFVYYNGDNHYDALIVRNGYNVWKPWLGRTIW